MMIIIIQEVTQNILVEKKFSPFCTISQVVDWCVKQFFNQTVEKKERGKEYYGLQFRGKWMLPETCLFSYGISSQVRKRKLLFIF